MGPRFYQLPVSVVSKRIPGALPTEDDRKQFKGADLSRVKLENDIYPLLTTAIDSVLSAASATNVRVLNTSTKRERDEHNRLTHLMNDVGIYSSSLETVKASTMDTTLTANLKRSTSRNADGPDTPGTSHVAFHLRHWLTVPITVKHNKSHTAFLFQSATRGATQKDFAPAAPPSANAAESETFIPDSADGAAALKQFVEYILNIFDNQHRKFSYAIYVWDSLARLCYFDRSGAVVSEQFNWTTADSPLHDFVWKVAHMTEAELGYDQTVSLATEAEAQEFTDIAKDPSIHEKIREFVKQAATPGQPIYRVDVMPMAAPPDEGLPDEPFPSHSDTSSPADVVSLPLAPVALEARSFLIGKAHFSSHSLFGRCTRGYIAYDMHEHRLCFLKDYWRPYVPHRTRPEHLILERMAHCGVTGVPTLICGGDVGGTHAQRTQMQVLRHAEAAPSAARVHFRMATVEIGLSLEEFHDYNELASAFADAVFAHYQAWERAKVLHHDISVRNILIDPLTRNGLLIDWDLCRVECELASGPTEPDLTGTWEFRSALAAQYPRKPYCLSDDIESFVHAFNYLVLKYHPIVGGELGQLVTSTYENYSIVQGIKVGGRSKLDHFDRPNPPFQVYANKNLAELVAKLVAKLHAGCFKSYRGVDRDQMQTWYGISNPVLRKQPSSVPTVPKDSPANRPKPVRAIARPPGLDESVDVTTPYHNSPNSARSSRTTNEAESPSAPVTTSTLDPSRLSGFLSHHSFLQEVLLAAIDEKDLGSKYDDQFVLRAEQDPILVFPRSRSRSHNISSMSMSTESDLLPILNHSRTEAAIGLWDDLPPFFGMMDG